MNKVNLMGRICREVETRYSGEMAVAKYALAVDRKGKDAGTDFINCVAFGKQGEFAEKYLRKGMKIAVSGRIQTGSYDGKNGKVYTTDVVVEDHYFCESKNSNEAPKKEEDAWMTIPDDVVENLPF